MKSIIQQIEDQTGTRLTELQGLNELLDSIRHRHTGSYVLEGGALVALNFTGSESPMRLELNAEECASLQYLNLSRNKGLSELKFTAPLPALLEINLSECALEELAIPAGCTKLKKAWLQKSQLKRMVFEGGCPKLLLLDLSENQIRELELPDGFDSLAYLFLKGNQLASLHFPTELPALDTLHLEGNQLKSFPKAILESSPVLLSLYLNNNPLPDAMRGTIEDSAGNSTVEFLQRYFQDLEKGGEVDNECKVLLIGNGNVGKSCLVNRLINKTFKEKWESTHAISLHPFPWKEYLLNLWDFAGQDIYHATHRLFMQSGAVYLVLWDWDTEENKPHLIYNHHGKERRFKNHKLPYWLDYAKHLGHGSPVIIVQTKTGQNGKKDLPHIREAYTNKLAFLEFHHIESKEDDWDDNGLNGLLSTVRKAVRLTKSTTEIPTNWVEIRRLLRKKQEEGEKSMTLSDYLALPQTQDLADDPQNVLINWLVKTGVVFYRKGMFHDKIILHQAWAIEAIYSLFDREREDEGYYTLLNSKNGKFTGKELSVIWKKNSESERELFLSFMLACEMCFETTPKEKEDYRTVPFEERQFVAPQLLEEVKPNSVSDIWMDRKGLYLRYHHEFLHYGVIQSFIVRTQALAELRDIWRYGISIKEDKMLALIEATEKTVQVLVTENGKPLLDKIRNLLEELQDNKGEESVSLNGVDYIPLDRLKNHPADIPKIETETPNVWVDVKPLSIFLQKDDRASFEGDSNEKESQLKHEKLKMEQPTPTKKPKVFVSYARKEDRRYLDLFVAGIKAHSEWEVFDDRLILIGEDWHERLQEEVQSCDFAILLLSPYFFKSDYIKNDEFERFVERSVNNGFPIFSVLLSDCDYLKWSEVARRQFFPALGQDYDLAKSYRDKQITFDLLARFDRDGELIPNPYLHTFYKNFVAAANRTIGKSKA